jgi:hypothetical protein
MKLTNEMARIASGIKLADQWEEIWNVQTDSIKKSTRFNRIIDYLKDNESGTLKSIAQEKFNSNDTASVNQQVRFLKQAGIIEDTGLVTPKKEKTSVNADGVKGRPKLSTYTNLNLPTNNDIKVLGLIVIKKFAKGDTNFSPEEMDLITQLYNSTTSTQKDSLNEGYINKIRWKKLNEGYINKIRWKKLAGM